MLLTRQLLASLANNWRVHCSCCMHNFWRGDLACLANCVYVTYSPIIGVPRHILASNITEHNVTRQLLASLSNYWRVYPIIGEYNVFCCFLNFSIPYVNFLQRTEVRSFVIPLDKQSKGAKVTNLGNLSKAVEVIKQKLGRRGVRLFKKTCFGHFLNLKPITFCSAIVHNLLVRQVECDDSNVIEFNFRGIGARFDRMAFAIVTGLNCGKYPVDHETRNLLDTLWEKYFGTSGPVSLKDLMTTFEATTFAPADVKNTVKVCMLYLLESVLLGGEKRRPVTRDNFSIIQNEELCDKYPWGNMSYDMTISSLRGAVNRNNPSKTYTLYGFPIAFQVIGHNLIYIYVLFRCDYNVLTFIFFMA